jgi:hypothetical protein
MVKYLILDKDLAGIREYWLLQQPKRWEEVIKTRTTRSII